MISNWHGDAITEKIMLDLCNKINEITPEITITQRVNIEQIGVIIANPVSNEVDDIVNKISRAILIYKNPEIDQPVHLRLSIGSVYFPLGTKDEVDCINKAHLALANVKTKEQAFYCDYEDAKRDHIDEQNEMIQLHHLQQAYNDKRLVLAFQPIISSITGEVLEYETLLRIKEPNGRFDSAGRFIPIAEKMGTVEAIDELVLQLVVETLKEHADIRLAINISNLTTTNDNWHRYCCQMLKDESIATRLTIEITETAAQKNLRKTAYFTASMQSLGCNVALDDFGVGFTSFRQLRSLSVDYVKIDGSYILGLEDNKENTIFIKSLIDFNKSYGLKTVAECVENGEVAKKLIDLGSDYMQGYYFGKPEVGTPWKNTPKPVTEIAVKA
jgi:EAL domain-containing protein (putative c-di-GMP-specific phosphodiesterase class I)